MWTGLWSSTISETWSSDIHCHIFHVLNLHSCVFILVLLGKLLIFLGQGPRISHEAGKFIVCWLLRALFAYAFLQPLVRYFQAQSLVIPMFICSCITLCFHIPFCWFMVYKAGLRNLGGALAMSISYWLNVTLLALYMIFSPKCEKTRGVISMEMFQGIREFFSLAIPSAVMVCLEWWSFELLILLSGLLPNPELETSVLSVWKMDDTHDDRMDSGDAVISPIVEEGTTSRRGRGPTGMHEITRVSSESHRKVVEYNEEDTHKSKKPKKVLDFSSMTSNQSSPVALRCLFRELEYIGGSIQIKVPMEVFGVQRRCCII